jgi:hypothetical protein
MKLNKKDTTFILLQFKRIESLNQLIEAHHKIDEPSLLMMEQYHDMREESIKLILNYFFQLGVQKDLAKVLQKDFKNLWAVAS